jgi:hypothetical protein
VPCGDLGSRRHGQTSASEGRNPALYFAFGIVVARLAELITES